MQAPAPPAPPLERVIRRPSGAPERRPPSAWGGALPSPAVALLRRADRPRHGRRGGPTDDPPLLLPVADPACEHRFRHVPPCTRSFPTRLTQPAPALPPARSRRRGRRAAGGGEPLPPLFLPPFSRPLIFPSIFLWRLPKRRPPRGGPSSQPLPLTAAPTAATGGGLQAGADGRTPPPRRPWAFPRLHGGHGERVLVAQAVGGVWGRWGWRQYRNRYRQRQQRRQWWWRWRV